METETLVYAEKKKNTPFVLVMAIAAFDRARQWPHRFTQMYRPKERLLIYTLQTCDKTLLTAAKTGVNCELLNGDWC